jgi:phage/plasmid-like protein (TIGR03299 family)
MMAANIFGNRFLGRRDPAWHKLGTVFTDPITASEAIEKAGLAYEIATRPVFASVPTALGVNELVEIADRRAVVREPVPDDNINRVLGVVSDQYEVVQNRQIAQALDLLTDRWPVETCGALGYGERVFFTLDAGTIDVAGRDPVRNYFLIANGNDGGLALHCSLTPVRVVCQNTLSLGLSQASVDIKLIHSKGVGDVLLDRVEAIDKFLVAQFAVEQLFNGMAKAPITAKNIADLLDGVYKFPAPLNDNASDKKQYEYQYNQDRATAGRDAFRELFGRWNDEQSWAANTVWGAYNALVEVEDYRDGRNAETSLLWGPRADNKKKAFSILAKQI